MDIQIHTLDGKGTFHGMGHIGVVSPPALKSVEVERRNVTDDEILNVSQIKKHFFAPTAKSDTQLKFSSYRDLSK